MNSECNALFRMSSLFSGKLVTPLWFLFAFLFPMFSVSLLRLDLGIYHFALPAFVLFVLVFIYVIKGLMGDIQRPDLKGYGLLSLLCSLFLVWHLVMTLKSADMVFALKEVIKLFTSLVCFWGILFFFPRDKRFLERFLVFVFWGMCILLSACIYQYAFVFKMPFLSADFDTVTRYSKNQLAYFLARLIPLVFLFFLYARNRRPMLLVPMVIMFISIIYSASRGSWVGVGIGVLIIFADMIRVNGWQGAKRVLKISAAFAVVAGASLFILSSFVNVSAEISQRMVSMYNPEKVEMYLGRHTMENRWTRVSQALDGFSTAPLTGVGLGNTTEYVNGLIHNDYAAVLLELGPVGFILFLGILAVVLKKIVGLGISLRGHDSWVFPAVLASFGIQLFISNVYDNYLSTYFWVFLSFYIVFLQTERKSLDLRAAGYRLGIEMKILVVSESPLEKIGSDYYAIDPWIRIPLQLSKHVEKVTLWSPVVAGERGSGPARGAWRVEQGKMLIEHHDPYNRFVQFYRMLPARYLAWRFKADRLIREHDVVIMRAPAPMTPIIMGSARRQGRPVIFMILLNVVTQSDRLLESRGLKRLLYSAATAEMVRQEKSAVRQAALVYVYSQELAERHRGLNENIELMQDPHLSMSDLVIREDTCQSEEISILRLCWLIPSKGVEYLLEAMALMRSRNLPVRLEVVGQERMPGYRASLERMAEDLGIRDKVKFLDWVPFTEVGKVYLRNDIQVLSSLGEGTPRIIVEGFARGLPLVCTNVGGCRDTLVHGKDALLIPPRDPQAIADSVERLIRDGELRRRMIKQGYESARAVTFENLGMKIIREIEDAVRRFKKI